ncbi:MAG: DEAD/DEAH box helicase [Porticoccaceae bacterium]|nr:DEAD/DEAH box helicase [Porticoccaceae bacterium]
MTFNELGLSAPILKAVASQGYSEPSPIQAKAIPAVLAGEDVMAAAQTGTGKTAGFTLPILERLSKGRRAGPNQARCLVLTPTRELAAQVGESVATYSKHLALSSTVVFGGVKINPQMMKLRRGVDVLVATPGRLMDLHSQNAVKFEHLEVLVLDEADRMLDMGFIHDIKRIINILPRRRQNLMFSATFSDDIRKLARGLVRNPIEISVSPRNAAAPSVTQWICPVDKKKKAPLLTKLIHDGQWGQALVFTKTKHGANKLTKHLESEGIVAAAIHGNKSQGARTKALAGFKAGEIRILVATDIAARGLDIEQLPQVVNFDLPNVAEDYVHRIGRTGRAGLTGQAISLVSADEVDLLSDIERLTQKLLPREEIEGFEPDQNVPETSLNAPVRRKKPRKALNSETKAGDNGRRSKSATNRSGYGQGPKPGGKRKSGGRNQSAASKDASKDGSRRSSDGSSTSQSKPRPKTNSAKPSGKSPYGSGGAKRVGGNRSVAGNRNSGSGRSGNR